MEKCNIESVREKLIGLIESEYESDAAFERALGLAPKTVNNWRRGRSSSFMRILPSLAENFSVSISELMDMPVGKDSGELSEEEMRLLALYRSSAILPRNLRLALAENLESTIRLYVSAFKEKEPTIKEVKRGRGK